MELTERWIRERYQINGDCAVKMAVGKNDTVKFMMPCENRELLLNEEFYTSDSIADQLSSSGVNARRIDVIALS